MDVILNEFWSLILQTWYWCIQLLGEISDNSLLRSFVIKNIFVSWYMVFVGFWKTTPNMHTSYSMYMSQIFGRVNSLKYVIAPKTLPLVIVKLLNVIIFPYRVYEIMLLISSRSQIKFPKHVINMWWWVTGGIRHNIFYNLSY